MNQRKRQILFPLFLLAFLLLLPQAGHAQTKSFFWERFDVDITLLENGDMRIVETQTLNFSGEPFTFGYGTILTGSSGNNDGITDIEVREGNQVYTQSSSGRPGTFLVSRSSDEVTIDWYFEPALGRRTYTFSYTVQGGVIVTPGEGSNQIFWKAIPDDHPARIQESAVTIHLPEGVQPQVNSNTGDYLVEGYAGGEASLVETRVSNDGRTVTYELTQPLVTGQALEVRLQFPHGILDIPVPDWQQRQARSDVLGLTLIGVAVLIMIAGPLLVLLLWYTRGRDPETGLVVPDYLTEPPEDLPPALVGTLVDEKADMRDIVSTLIDLARRGYLLMSEQKSTHTFHRTDKPDQNLRPFERQLLRDIFGRKQERKLSALRYKFHKKLPKLRSMLYEEMVEHGFADHSPDKIRSRYTVLGVFIFFIAFVAFIGASASLPEEIGYVGFCLGFAIGITGVALAIAARAMPAKTAKGAEEAAKWLAFKQYLQNIEQYEDLVDKQAIFEKYLPYATAFGLDRTWIRKFSQVPYMPIPPWYYGMGHPVLMGESRASGRTATTGGRGTGPGGLEGMSDSLSGGLESISSGLTRMLNSTASTLKSTPPSSSSSSGGFSGGGSFSSGGGGSRGFG